MGQCSKFEEFKFEDLRGAAKYARFMEVFKTIKGLHG